MQFFKNKIEIQLRRTIYKMPVITKQLRTIDYGIKLNKVPVCNLIMSKRLQTILRCPRNVSDRI